MLEKIPSEEEMESLIGTNKFQIWTDLGLMLDNIYDMDCIWSKGGKKWTYEYKYRRGGKTLCALYARDDCFGFMIIFGKSERENFEINREIYSKEILQVYDEATTYHDGKWLMFELTEKAMFDDLRKLLAIKRKPNH